MKKNYSGLFFMLLIYCSCSQQAGQTKQTAASSATGVTGTWKLLTGTLIENGNTTVTDYTINKSFIKIITPTHFSFLSHTLRKDTTDFSAGGGRCIINDTGYTEMLDYCSAKEWEGQQFNFTLHLQGDTLVQSGIEKVEAKNINRMNIEKYVRVKD